MAGRKKKTEKENKPPPSPSPMMAFDDFKKNMNLINRSPGFHHIIENIFMCLDHSSLLNCRKVVRVWNDLLKNLGRIVDKKDYSDDEIENMTAKDKQRLILADPVTCARHFNHRTKVLFSQILGADNGPLGKMVEYFYRVEFQHRVSYSQTNQ